MIRSMTGFGRGEYEIEGRKYTVEIKSVNHKYADISIDELSPFVYCSPVNGSFEYTGVLLIFG